MSVKYKFKVDRIEGNKIVSDEITLGSMSTTIGCLGPIFQGFLDRLDEKATGKKINYGPAIDH